MCLSGIASGLKGTCCVYIQRFSLRDLAQPKIYINITTVATVFVVIMLVRQHSPHFAEAMSYCLRAVAYGN